MDEERSQYSIGMVARQTGLSPHLIRMWERRYEVVSPKRGESGARLYSRSDVDHLQRLRSVTEAGMTIGRASQLTPAELEVAALELSARPRPIPPAPREAFGGERHVAPVLAAVEALDGPRVHAALMQAALALGTRDFMANVAVPLLDRVGALWANGKICPAHEHLFSVQLRRVLGWLLESVSGAVSTRAAVATTPTGQRHELGAMLAAVTAAVEGWRVTYLGPDLPPRDIATAVEITGASMVLLSVPSEMPEHELIPQLRDLRASLPADVAILVGGAGAEKHSADIETSGAQLIVDLDELARRLRGATAEPNDTVGFHPVEA